MRGFPVGVLTKFIGDQGHVDCFQSAGPFAIYNTAECQTLEVTGKHRSLTCYGVLSPSGHRADAAHVRSPFRQTNRRDILVEKGGNFQYDQRNIVSQCAAMVARVYDDVSDFDVLIWRFIGVGYVILSKTNDQIVIFVSDSTKRKCQRLKQAKAKCHHLLTQ